jgi:hypothetical protein
MANKITADISRLSLDGVAERLAMGPQQYCFRKRYSVMAVLTMNGGLLSRSVYHIRKQKSGTGAGQIFTKKKKHLPNYQ